jgi:predicted transcriptional regulator
LVVIFRRDRIGYRRKLDIIADMLHVTNQGAKKTQIMYQANLNHGLMTRHLNEIRKASLISFERKRRCYVLTPKGKQFLEVYGQYLECVKNMEMHGNEADGKRRILESLCSRKNYEAPQAVESVDGYRIPGA